jgi:hypothetical protein
MSTTRSRQAEAASRGMCRLHGSGGEVSFEGRGAKLLRTVVVRSWVESATCGPAKKRPFYWFANESRKRPRLVKQSMTASIQY